jgi:DNA-binding response OmpR family regulator
MTATLPRILVLDDDPAYGRQIAAYLQAQGCTVAVTQEPQTFQQQMEHFAPDLILLDQRLGDVRGTELLLNLRQRSSTPCIIVTGVSDLTDRILNLEIGADDEVEKTAAPRELLARIRAVLRRHVPRGRDPAPSKARDRQIDGWVLSALRRDLIRPDGTGCNLTSSEFETLALLWDALGRPVSRAAISEAVFKRPHRPGDRAVDTVVMKLRVKIAPGNIRAVRIAGYVFTGFTVEEDQ